MTERDIANLLEQRKTSFIETRAQIENEVTKFLQSLEAADNDVQEKCKFRPGVTARDLLPALWVEPFDPETYNKQLTDLNTYVDYVKAIFDSINKEALQCLQA